MKINKICSRQDRLITRLFWLSSLRIILPKLQEFISNPYYLGIESGTPTEDMSIFFHISSFYNLWIIKVVVPIITVIIVYTLCEILRLIVNGIVKQGQQGIHNEKDMQ